jgi:small subunit ribosomal protein S17
MNDTASQTKIAEKTQPKQLKGIVMSTKMKDTIVVAVNNFSKIPKYEKYVKITKRFKAHDFGNTKKVGETVIIEECRPISRHKHFRVI